MNRYSHIWCFTVHILLEGLGWHPTKGLAFHWEVLNNVLLAIQGTGKPKIWYLDNAIASQQEVAACQISVHDTTGGHVFLYKKQQWQNVVGWNVILRTEHTVQNLPFLGQPELQISVTGLFLLQSFDLVLYIHHQSEGCASSAERKNQCFLISPFGTQLVSVTTEYPLFPTEKLGVWRCGGGGGWGSGWRKYIYWLGLWTVWMLLGVHLKCTQSIMLQ